jgi:galactokinase
MCSCYDSDVARTRSFWAPGRVNLIGEYTDLVGGPVLPAALDLGIRLDVEPADAIRLESEDAEPGWTRYVDAVEVELGLLGRPPIGIAGTVSSTLPIGAGLSSSAALEVAVALALCAVAEFPLDPLELAQAARRAEHRAVGVPCGIMDQAASVLGRVGRAILLDTATLAYEPVALPRELALVVLHSGTPRRLEGSGYATRKRELEEGHPARLRHVTSEAERVLQAVDALRAADLARLGEVFLAGHESLRVDFECTTPELDRLVELAYAHGAVAARMTGGGFGGAIVALTDAPEELAERVLGDYGPRGRAYVCAASGGAREL